MKNLILYVNPNGLCPKCEILYDLLKEKNIDFTLCDDKCYMLECGIRNVPILEIQETDEMLDFTTAIDYIENLKEN